MNVAEAAPVCRIIAGPNGAGKTTFALNQTVYDQLVREANR